MTKGIRQWIVLGVLGIILCGCREAMDATEAAQETTEIVQETDEEEVPLELSIAYALQSSSGFEDMEEFSDGKIRFKVYPGGILGTEQEIIQGVKTGSISLVSCSSASMTEFVPELAVLDIPGVFDDVESCNRLLQGEISDWLQTYYNRAGFQLILLSCSGFRQVTSNRRVEQVEDFQGLPMRVMENAYHEAFWQSLGAETTSLDFDKLAYSLQQGNVEAQENLISSSVKGGLMEYQKYLVITNHIPHIRGYVMNKEAYDAMNEEERQILCEFLQEKNRLSLEGAAEFEAENRRSCEELYGVEICVMSEEEQEKMRSHNQAVIDLLKKNLGEELVEEYLQQVSVLQ